MVRGPHFRVQSESYLHLLQEFLFVLFKLKNFGLGLSVKSKETAQGTSTAPGHSCRHHVTAQPPEQSPKYCGSYHCYCICRHYYPQDNGSAKPDETSPLSQSKLCAHTLAQTLQATTHIWVRHSMLTHLRTVLLLCLQALCSFTQNLCVCPQLVSGNGELGPLLHCYRLHFILSRCTSGGVVR